MGLSLLLILVSGIHGGVGAYDVTLFDNSRYVDYTGWRNIRDLLDSQGITHQEVTSVTSTIGWTNDIVIVPDMERRLETEMTSNVKSAIRSKVDSGGLLIVGNAGYSLGHYTCSICVEAVWIDTVFGWNLESSRTCTHGTWSQTSRARDLPALRTVTSLQDRFHTTGLTISSLPTGGEALYTRGLCTSVAVIPYGNGLVVMLGYDYSVLVDDWNAVLAGLLSARNVFGRNTPAFSPYCDAGHNGLTNPCKVDDYCCDQQCTHCGPRLYCQQQSPFYSFGRMCSPVDVGPKCANYFQHCVANTASQARPLLQAAVILLASLLARLVYV